MELGQLSDSLVVRACVRAAYAAAECFATRPTGLLFDLAIYLQLSTVTPWPPPLLRLSILINIF